MPHRTLSNCSASWETVTAGTVTTAHSRTWTIGPSTTWKDKQRQLRDRGGGGVMMRWIHEGPNGNIMSNQKSVYLYWHDNTCVPHLQVGALGGECNCKGLCRSTGKVLHSLDVDTESFDEATKHSKCYSKRQHVEL